MGKTFKCIRCKKEGRWKELVNYGGGVQKTRIAFRHLGAKEYLCRDCWWTCKVKYG